MKRNRNKYNQTLNLRGILWLGIGAMVVAGLACGFVHVRTQQVTRGGEKGALEREIDSLKKEIAVIASKVADTLDPEAMKKRLLIEGSDLEDIGHAYNPVQGDFTGRMAMSDNGGYAFP